MDDYGKVRLYNACCPSLPVLLRRLRYTTASAGLWRRALVATLEAHPESPLVFPNQDGAHYSRVHVSRIFRKAAKVAGLKDFRFHNLRHHGATMALNAGFTAPVVMALGGWKSEAMMRRYAAVTDQTLRAAAEAVSGSEAESWKS